MAGGGEATLKWMLECFSKGERKKTSKCRPPAEIVVSLQCFYKIFAGVYLWGLAIGKDSFFLLGINFCDFLEVAFK